MKPEAGPDAGWRWFLPALLAASAACRLLLAVAFPGFHSGDDLEIVESAARYAVGFPYAPWGIRSLFHPILFAAPWVWAGEAVGAHGARAETILATIPTTLFSTAGIWLVWRLTRALGWEAAAGRAAAFLYATHTLPLTYGSMPYPRPISTAFVLAAFLLLAGGEGSARAVAAGAAVAAAMAVRWSDGVMVLPLLAFAAWRIRRPAAVAGVLAGFAAGLVLFVGLFDLATYGRPFASLAAFVRYSLDPSGWGSGRPPRAWFWYGSNLLGWAGPLLVLLALCALKDRRAGLPLALAAAAVVLLSFSPMKQPRYLQVAIPFLAMAAALGWQTLRRRIPALATLALVLSLPLGLERSLHVLRRKSLSAFAAAEVLAAMPRPPRVVALEQAWAYGDRLSLGAAVDVRDVVPWTPLPVEPVLAAASGAQALALYAEDLSPSLERALEADWRPCASFRIADSPGVALFLRRDLPCPAPGGGGVSAARPRS